MKSSLRGFDFPAGRFLLFFSLLPWFYLPGFDLVLRRFGYDWNWFEWSVAYSMYGQVMLAAAAAGIVWLARIDRSAIVGKPLIGSELGAALKVTGFVFVASVAINYAIFVPLSYLAPDFVQWWYIDSLVLIFVEPGDPHVLANLGHLVTLAVIAPVVEEVVFRGLLLHRWRRKWSLKSAVVISSLCFGALHPDPVSAFVFGVAMCILYLRTQSLIVPIACHSIYNLAVWSIAAIYLLVDGPGQTYTLEDFRGEWFFGVIAAAIVIVWSTIFLRRPASARSWSLPAGREVTPMPRNLPSDRSQ